MAYESEMPLSATRRASNAAFSFVLPLSALLATLLVFAPIFRGGNRPLPLLVLELLALCVFVLIIVQRRAPRTGLDRGEQ